MPAFFTVRDSALAPKVQGLDQRKLAEPIEKLMSKSWYLVHAKPKQEFVADANLRRQGYETFLPTRRETVRRAGRFHSVRVAHFPSYLFVAIDRTVQRWRPINHTYGVRRIVGTGEQPIPTPQGVVEALQAVVTHRGEFPPQERLQAGERVSLCDGPLAGYEGVVEALIGDNRVKVLLDLHESPGAVVVPRNGCAKMTPEEKIAK